MVVARIDYLHTRSANLVYTYVQLALNASNIRVCFSTQGVPGEQGFPGETGPKGDMGSTGGRGDTGLPGEPGKRVSRR